MTLYHMICSLYGILGPAFNPAHHVPSLCGLCVYILVRTEILSASAGCFSDQKN